MTNAPTPDPLPQEVLLEFAGMNDRQVLETIIHGVMSTVARRSDAGESTPIEGIVEITVHSILEMGFTR